MGPEPDEGDTDEEDVQEVIRLDDTEDEEPRVQQHSQPAPDVIDLLDEDD